MAKGKKPVVLTRALEQKLYKKFLIITLAYFMEIGAFAETDEEDRPKFTLNEKGEKIYTTSVEKLQEAFNDLQGWLCAVQDHLINIQQVTQMVEERLNTEVAIRVD